jgi:hypothetical protein
MTRQVVANGLNGPNVTLMMTLMSPWGSIDPVPPLMPQWTQCHPDATLGLNGPSATLMPGLIHVDTKL